MLIRSRTYKAKVSYLADDAVDMNDTTADHAVHRAQGVCMANCMHCNYTAQMDVEGGGSGGGGNGEGGGGAHEPVKFTKAAKRVSLVRCLLTVVLLTVVLRVCGGLTVVDYCT